MTIANIWRSLQGQARRWLPPKGGGAHAVPQNEKGASGARRLGWALGASVLMAATGAWAEGTPTMYPQGYFPGESGFDTSHRDVGRAPMMLLDPTGTSNGTPNKYVGVINKRTFLYVYAKAGEKIVAVASTSASSNTGNVGATIYRPTLGGNFGTKGGESPAGFNTASVTATAISGANAAARRTSELSGPGVGWAMTNAYEVQETGIHGLLFSGNTKLPIWDVTVTSSDGSQKYKGRVFTYVYAGDTGGNTSTPGAVNSTGYRIFSSLYYVTGDGYRYRQQMKGLDPYQFVLYSNSRGFLDNGQPLYRDVVGTDNSLSTFGNAAGTSTYAELAADLPAYPIFFTDISGGEVNETLDALGIPRTPPSPIISAPEFKNHQASGNSTYVGFGGVFTFNATDVTSYMILIKNPNASSEDPAEPLNRVLRGTAMSGLNTVNWDGLDNLGNPFPASSQSYQFEIVGRNGEAHFPFLDAEYNFNGGPIVTQLNGEAEGSRIVYYDDRGYKTSAKNLVGSEPDDGNPNSGNVCGAGKHGASPVQGLNGVDSGLATIYGSSNNTGGVNVPRYARYWGVNGKSGTGCATEAFGDRLGLDLYVLQKGAPQTNINGVLILDGADVTTRISVPPNVAAGSQVTAVIEFGNIGSKSADGVQYSAQLPDGLDGVSCVSGATCFYDRGTGVLTISGLPGSLSPGQWVPAITLVYTAPDSGPVQVSSAIVTTTPEPDGHATNTAVGSSAIGGVAANEADVSVTLTAPTLASPDGSVSVPIVFRNNGPESAAGVTYSAKLPAGMSASDVSCAGATCTYNPANGTVTITGLPGSLAAGGSQSIVLTYKAPHDPGEVRIEATIATTTAESRTDNNTANGRTRVVVAGGAEDKADVTVSVAPPATAAVGSNVTVPVKFENYGPKAADGVTYSVTVTGATPKVGTCVPNTCTITGNTITWPSSSLPNGGKFEPTFQYEMPASEVTVNAVVNTTTTESNTLNNTASAKTKPVEPDMAVTVNVPATPVKPGDPVSGTVVCENLGGAAATNATCVVDQPPGVTNWTLNCTPPTLPVASLAPNGKITCNYSFDMPPGGASNPPKVKGKTGADNEPEDKKGNNEQEKTVPAQANPDVYATIQMPGSADSGDQVTALLTFGNSGTSVAEGVTYKVTGLPQGLGTVSCGATATCTYDSTTGTVTITGLPTALAPGQKQEVELRWTVPDNQSATTYTLKSEVTTTTPGDPLPNNSAEAPLAVPKTPQQKGEVTTTVQVPPTAETGKTVNGTVKYVNTGSVDTTGMVYKVTLSTGTPVVKYKGTTCTVGAGGVLSDCNLPTTLKKGESLELDVSYPAPAAGDTLTVTTTVEAGNDTDLTNNTASGPTQGLLAVPAPTPDVTTSVAPPPTAVPGTMVEVPVTFENLGPATAEEVVYKVTLPPNLTDVSCTPAACTYDPGTGEVTVTPGGLPTTLPPGGKTTLTVKYKAPSSGTVKTKARVDARDEPDANKPNNTAEAETRIIEPGTLKVTKTVYEGHDSGAKCGTAAATKELLIVEKNPTYHNLTWCFEVENTGSEYLGAPVWDDQQLPNATFIPKTALPLAPSAKGIWYVQSAHNKSVLNTVALTMPVTDSAGTLIPNAPPATGSDTVRTTFGMIYDPPFGVKVGSVNGTNTIRWTMVWVNDNVVAANNVTVSDEVKAPMTYLNDGTLACVPEGTTTVVSCTYDAATKRVIAVANFGADFGETVATAQNRLFIAFNVSVPAAAGEVKNQGHAEWTPPPAKPGDPTPPKLEGDTTYIRDMTIGPVTPNNPVPPSVGLPPGVTGGKPDPNDPNTVVPTPVGPATPKSIPVDNPLALLVAALGIMGLMARQGRRARR